MTTRRLQFHDLLEKIVKERYTFRSRSICLLPVLDRSLIGVLDVR